MGYSVRTRQPDGRPSSTRRSPRELRVSRTIKDIGGFNVSFLPVEELYPIPVGRLADKNPKQPEKRDQGISDK